MLASTAKTVNPLHSRITIQQNNDKVESALRAPTFRKIGQHGVRVKLLVVDLSHILMAGTIATAVPGIMQGSTEVSNAPSLVF